MVLPLIIGAVVAAGAAAASAGIASKANSEMSDRLQQMGIDIKNVPLPELTKLYLQEINPDLHNVPADVIFEIVKRDPKTRDTISNAIYDIKQQSLQSTDTRADAERRMAAMEANRQAGADINAIRSSMAARGRGGSGLEATLSAIAAQQGANRQYMGGLRSASDAQNERLMALKAYKDALSADEAFDVGIQGQNANTLNQQRRYNADRQQAARDRNVDLLNQAKILNNQNRQNMAAFNNSVSQSDFANRMGRVNAVNNIGQEQNKVTAKEAANWGDFANRIGNIALKATGDVSSMRPSESDQEDKYRKYW